MNASHVTLSSSASSTKSLPVSSVNDDLVEFGILSRSSDFLTDEVGGVAARIVGPQTGHAVHEEHEDARRVLGLVGLARVPVGEVHGLTDARPFPAAASAVETTRRPVLETAQIMLRVHDVQFEHVVLLPRFQTDQRHAPLAAIVFGSHPRSCHEDGKAVARAVQAPAGNAGIALQVRRTRT